MSTQSEPILVVGGGLGGMSTALALGRKGIPVRLLELTAELGAIGYGIQLGPNVFHMFERLGVTDAVLRASDFPPGVLWLDAYSGREITRVATGAAFRERFKFPYIIIHRVDLHHVLLDACQDVGAIAFEPSATVTGYEEHDNHVVALTADGRRVRGRALIGADGLRSRIRAQLVGDGEPKPLGWVAHRTIVPMDRVPAGISRADVVLWGGEGFHIVHYPLRHGTTFNIVAVFRTPTYGERGEVEAYRAELLHTYRDAHPAMKALLEMMDLERRWPIADRDPARGWCRGRVALLGDAAHPTLQSYAQGACMAIEDAVCLAELIALLPGDLPAAFRRYEAERVVRTARVQLESRYMWTQYHAEGLERDVVHRAFLERSQADIWRCLAWLYDGYAPPAALDDSSRRAQAVAS